MGHSGFNLDISPTFPAIIGPTARFCNLTAKAATLPGVGYLLLPFTYQIRETLREIADQVKNYFPLALKRALSGRRRVKFGRTGVEAQDPKPLDKQSAAQMLRFPQARARSMGEARRQGCRTGDPNRSFPSEVT